MTNPGLVSFEQPSTDGPAWTGFLASRGAQWTAAPGRVLDFGDGAGERRAARDAGVVCDLSHLALLGFSGDDAQTFLQGQLTCDVLGATRQTSIPGALCTPKGRALATFRLWQDAAGYCMLLPAELAAAISKRLSMYVLRAKVKVSDRSAEHVRLGVAGPAGSSSLVAALGLDSVASLPATALPANALPAAALPPTALPAAGAVAETGGVQVLGLDAGRYLLLVAPETAGLLWTRLSALLVPAGDSAWRWAAIAAREPALLPPTQEQFVPQMLNLDLVGGIGFQKGCYTGQEIVARTQYLGKLKQRLFHAHLDVDTPPLPGALLFSDDFDGQSTGMVIDAASSPDGGVDLLAVIRRASAAGRPIRLERVDGPVLSDLSLPAAADSV